jgi:hypothetical protein
MLTVSKAGDPLLLIRRLTLCWFLILTAANGFAAGPSIVVTNPARLAAVEPGSVYIEPYLAVDPNDSRHLIVAALAFPPSGKSCSLQTFCYFRRRQRAHPSTPFNDDFPRVMQITTAGDWLR